MAAADVAHGFGGFVRAAGTPPYLSSRLAWQPDARLLQPAFAALGGEVHGLFGLVWAFAAPLKDRIELGGLSPLLLQPEARLGTPALASILDVVVGGFALDAPLETLAGVPKVRLDLSRTDWTLATLISLRPDSVA